MQVQFFTVLRYIEMRNEQHNTCIWKARMEVKKRTKNIYRSKDREKLE